MEFLILLSYQYHPITGALVSETYPSGRVVTNSFDNFGRLSSVSSKANQTQTLRIYANGFGYELKENGLEARMRLGNGLWETVKLNSLSQPVEISLGTSASNANRLKLNYTYGVRDTNGNLDLSKNNGNVESQTITVPAIGNVQGFTTTQFYEYDELNRIKRAKEKRQTEQQPDWQQQFSYDRYGNRTVVTNNNATTESLVGPNPEINTATNRIVPKQNSSEQYLFDASGNMTRDAVGNVFTFDAENHQKTYTPVNPQEPSATYSYDGDGRRVKKQVGNETTVFVYDGGGKLVAEYTLNIQPPTTPQTVYTTTDVLGSPRINTNQKGEVLARHDYLPFGDEIIGFGQRASNQGYGMPDSTRQRFTGYEKDKETGLDFAQARYYGNGLGRFTSVDPSLESINLTSPQSWNRYVYVLNNPLNLTDPSGLVGNPPNWYIPKNPNSDDGKSFIPVRIEGTPPEGYRPAPDSFRSVSGRYYVYSPVTDNYVSFDNDLGEPPTVSGEDSAVVQVLSDTTIGAGKELYNFAVSLPNTVNAPIDYGLSFFTDFRFGQFEYYQPSTPGERNAMGAVLVLSVITPNGQRRIAGVVAGESGRYADLIRRSFAYDGIQIHHMPQAAMNFTSRADGGAIALTDLEHSFTRTFAGRGRVVANQERGMPFRTILARDIRDVRRITGSKYNQGLLELLDYYRANHSSLMLK